MNVRVLTPGLGRRSPPAFVADRLLLMGVFIVHPCAFIACAFVLGACSSNNLPSGWENATRAMNFVQEACPNSGMEFSNERASFSGRTGGIDVDYQHAHFRCEQDVEGFFKTAGDTVDILVQPIDMHPGSVAGCDCGYDITFIVEPVSAGTMQTTLYRRWDGQNNSNDPVQIATALVSVQ